MNFAAMAVAVSVAVAGMEMAARAQEVRSALTAPKVAEAVEVDRVWAGHPVGFALLTGKGTQYVAYYNATRDMVVASRKPGSSEWVRQVLPSRVGWDSHNYIAMALDDEGQLHVSGNMHGHPLVYFRTKTARDVTSLEQVRSMVGTEEGRCTYPRFFRGPKEELIFTYRDGGSGDGNQIYNVYEGGGRWRRLLDRPLTEGEGERNAYISGPVRGPDGYFHMLWVWRETPDAATNHSPTYARSRDLVNWEKGDGTPLPLPVTLKGGDVIDAVPVKGGIINGNTVIGFDSRNRVVLGYHKYDADGRTQIYNARLEDGRWRVYQTSDWDWRWEFGGGGSIPFEVGLGPVTVQDGALTQSYRNAKHGSGVWKLDEATLKPIGQVAQRPRLPGDLGKVEQAFEGLGVKWQEDAGGSGEKGARYVLRWETLGVNRDRPREGKLPEPSVLRVYKLVDAE